MFERKSFFHLLTPPVIARFWRLVDRRGDGECWPWRGEISKTTGYGVFYVRSKVRLNPHRVSLALRLGREVVETHTRHQCHNRPCCNPWHLLPGSAQDNVDDNARDKRPHGRLNMEAYPESLRAECRRLYDSGMSIADVARETGTYRALLRFWFKDHPGRIRLYLERRGERISLKMLCERHSLAYSVVYGRLKSGWSIEKALSEPVREKARNRFPSTRASM